MANEGVPVMNMKKIINLLKENQVEFKLDSMSVLVSFKGYYIYIGKAFTVLKSLNGQTLAKTVTRDMTDEEVVFFNMQYGRALVTHKAFMQKLVEVLTR
jgi:Uri superfamily endonuclease